MTKSASHGLIGHRVGRPGYRRMIFPSCMVHLAKGSVTVSMLVFVFMLVSVMVRCDCPRVSLRRDELLWMVVRFLHGLWFRPPWRDSKTSFHFGHRNVTVTSPPALCFSLICFRARACRSAVDQGPPPLASGHSPHFRVGGGDGERDDNLLAAPFKF